VRPRRLRCTNQTFAHHKPIGFWLTRPGIGCAARRKLKAIRRLRIYLRSLEAGEAPDTGAGRVINEIRVLAIRWHHCGPLSKANGAV
jgi:hypothetical protein